MWVTKSSELNFSFRNHTMGVQEGMRFYLSTDGLWDQLGESRNKQGHFRFPSFGKRRFADLLGQIGHFSFEEQRKILLRAFEAYRGEEEQLDDVTVVGFGFESQVFFRCHQSLRSEGVLKRSGNSPQLTLSSDWQIRIPPYCRIWQSRRSDNQIRSVTISFSFHDFQKFLIRRFHILIPYSNS